ncbi:MAG: hypothetical protein JWO41_852 [Candidatus Saccharibacteria bacterium]|nr:hypothetical protein [Candidatus Saccharibacteria bacterium]
MSNFTRARFNAGLMEARDQGILTGDLSTEDLLHRGKKRQYRAARIAGAVVVGTAAFLGAAVHGLEKGSAGPLDNGPEPRLSNQEIAVEQGGNSEAVQQAAEQAAREEAAQPTPTDIQPAGK